MHHDHSILRRTHLGATNSVKSMDDSMPSSSNTMGRRQKGQKSILPLSCHRWIVRFLALRKTSQVLIAIVLILFLLLLPLTVYSMSSLSIPDLDRSAVTRTRRKNRGHRGSIESIPMENAINNMINDKYEIYSDASLKEFTNRASLPLLQSRVVMLTDKNHTYRFAFPPGDVTARATHSSSLSFPLPIKGESRLRSGYVELRTINYAQKTPADQLDKNGCKAIDPSWQNAYHPTCNQIHEASGGWQQPYRMPTTEERKKGLLNDADEDREQLRFVNQGAFRHVWMIRDAHDGITRRAMKTLRSLDPFGRSRTKSNGKKFDLRNHDRHRRDAMAFEQLSQSPFIVDLYASCSNSAIFDYADGGDLTGFFDDKAGDENEKTPEEVEQSKLHIMQIAYNISMSVHHAHHFDAQGRATMAHTDIKTDQFIYQDGYYKLSDFNRVRFLSWNPKKNEQCEFTVGKNGGSNRSPEEYSYFPETEKVDVYSLGNVLYFLLTKKAVWKGYDYKKIYDLVKSGQRPTFPKQMYGSKEIFEKSMMDAIEYAWIQDPKKRPGALDVANIIKEGIELKKRSRMIDSRNARIQKSN